MNATMESSRSDAAGGLDLQLVSAICGLALALSLALLTGAWNGAPSTPEVPASRRIPPVSDRYRAYTTTAEQPSSTIYVLRTDEDFRSVQESIDDYHRSSEMYALPPMDYSILMARTPEDDFDIDRIVYERSLEYSANGMVLHIVDMRNPRN